jgi:NAD(P)-dependent dehydrogenase (short-subunit alcohol dehydrogenase family)
VLIPEVVVEPSLAELTSLHGRWAVVTGAGAGVGAAVVARLVEAGARVVVADLDGDAAARVAGRHGSAAVPAAVDVTDAQAVDALARSVPDRYGSLDIWVNNAGIYPRDPVLDMPEERWRQVLDTNLSGAFFGARAAAREMVSGGHGGVVVNIASLSAFRAPSADLTHYVASKAGVVGLTRSLAVELGPRGIRVLGVAPGFVPTENALGLLEQEGVHDAPTTFAARIPLRRVLAPDDIARAVFFAVSGLAGMMSGSTLVVDGGQLSG